MDVDIPITSLCIVFDPNRCPPNYELILKIHGKNEDCDLWREGGFLRTSKITRYLCFSRKPISSFETDEVLIDISVQNEKELPPPGFRIIERTNDSHEKALKKRQIGVKYADVGSTSEAICDLIILNRYMKPPSLYTMIGEINGLLLCCKMCKINSINHVNSRIDQHINYNMKSSPTHSNNSCQNINHNQQPAISYYENGYKQFEHQNPALSDIPFRLHKKYSDSQELHKISLPISQIKSLLDIENEYYYSFQLEATVLQDS